MELLFRTLPGISHHKVYFSEKAISEKMEIDILLIKERLKELHKAQYLYYMDGEKASVKFLEHRNDRALQGKYFLLFKQIQRNKLQKWEESKFFVRNSDYCKMKMILAYFGEDKLKNCGQCSVCQKSNLQLAKVDISQQILQVLAQKPRTIDEMSYHFSYLSKNELLEKIILLLDHEKIKMLDFKTYRLA
jgi:ATP-dependent DNA helicase RecQ